MAKRQTAIMGKRYAFKDPPDLHDMSIPSIFHVSGEFSIV